MWTPLLKGFTLLLSAAGCGSQVLLLLASVGPPRPPGFPGSLCTRNQHDAELGGLPEDFGMQLLVWAPPSVGVIVHEVVDVGER